MAPTAKLGISLTLPSHSLVVQAKLTHIFMVFSTIKLTSFVLYLS